MATYSGFAYIADQVQVTAGTTTTSTDSIALEVDDNLLHFIARASNGLAAGVAGGLIILQRHLTNSQTIVDSWIEVASYVLPADATLITVNYPALSGTLDNLSASPSASDILAFSSATFRFLMRATGASDVFFDITAMTGKG